MGEHPFLEDAGGKLAEALRYQPVSHTIHIRLGSRPRWRRLWLRLLLGEVVGGMGNQQERS
jgi:hypothetical protein